MEVSIRSKGGIALPVEIREIKRVSHIVLCVLLACICGSNIIRTDDNLNILVQDVFVESSMFYSKNKRPNRRHRLTESIERSCKNEKLRECASELFQKICDNCKTKKPSLEKILPYFSRNQNLFREMTVKDAVILRLVIEKGIKSGGIPVSSMSTHGFVLWLLKGAIEHCNFGGSSLFELEFPFLRLKEMFISCTVNDIKHAVNEAANRDAPAFGGLNTNSDSTVRFFSENPIPDVDRAQVDGWDKELLVEKCLERLLHCSEKWGSPIPKVCLDYLLTDPDLAKLVAPNAYAHLQVNGNEVMLPIRNAADESYDELFEGVPAGRNASGAFFDITNILKEHKDNSIHMDRSLFSEGDEVDELSEMMSKVHGSDSGPVKEFSVGKLGPYKPQQREVGEAEEVDFTKRPTINIYVDESRFKREVGADSNLVEKWDRSEGAVDLFTRRVSDPTKGNALGTLFFIVFEPVLDLVKRSGMSSIRGVVSEVLMSRFRSDSAPPISVFSSLIFSNPVFASISLSNISKDVMLSLLSRLLQSDFYGNESDCLLGIQGVPALDTGSVFFKEKLERPLWLQSFLSSVARIKTAINELTHEEALENSVFRFANNPEVGKFNIEDMTVHASALITVRLLNELKSSFLNSSGILASKKVREVYRSIENLGPDYAADLDPNQMKYLNMIVEEQNSVFNKYGIHPILVEDLAQPKIPDDPNAPASPQKGEPGKFPEKGPVPEPKLENPPKSTPVKRPPPPVLLGAGRGAPLSSTRMLMTPKAGTESTFFVPQAPVKGPRPNVAAEPSAHVSMPSPIRVRPEFENVEDAVDVASDSVVVGAGPSIPRPGSSSKKTDERKSVWYPDTLASDLREDIERDSVDQGTEDDVTRSDNYVTGSEETSPQSSEEDKATLRGSEEDVELTEEEYQRLLEEEARRMGLKETEPEFHTALEDVPSRDAINPPALSEAISRAQQSEKESTNPYSESNLKKATADVNKLSAEARIEAAVAPSGSTSDPAAPKPVKEPPTRPNERHGTASSANTPVQAAGSGDRFITGSKKIIPQNSGGQSIYISGNVGGSQGRQQGNTSAGGGSGGQDRDNNGPPGGSASGNNHDPEGRGLCYRCFNPGHRIGVCTKKGIRCLCHECDICDLPCRTCGTMGHSSLGCISTPYVPSNCDNCCICHPGRQDTSDRPDGQNPPGPPSKRQRDLQPQGGDRHGPPGQQDNSPNSGNQPNRVPPGLPGPVNQNSFQSSTQYQGREDVIGDVPDALIFDHTGKPLRKPDGSYLRQRDLWLLGNNDDFSNSQLPPASGCSNQGGDIGAPDPPPDPSGRPNTQRDRGGPFNYQSQGNDQQRASQQSRYGSYSSNQQQNSQRQHHQQDDGSYGDNVPPRRDRSDQDRFDQEPPRGGQQNYNRYDQGGPGQAPQGDNPRFSGPGPGNNQRNGDFQNNRQNDYQNSGPQQYQRGQQQDGSFGPGRHAGGNPFTNPNGAPQWDSTGIHANPNQNQRSNNQHFAQGPSNQNFNAPDNQSFNASMNPQNRTYYQKWNNAPRVHIGTDESKLGTDLEPPVFGTRETRATGSISLYKLLGSGKFHKHGHPSNGISTGVLVRTIKDIVNAEQLSIDATKNMILTVLSREGQEEFTRAMKASGDNLTSWWNRLAKKAADEEKFSKKTESDFRKIIANLPKKQLVSQVTDDLYDCAYSIIQSQSADFGFIPQQKIASEAVTMAYRGLCRLCKLHLGPLWRTMVKVPDLNASDMTYDDYTLTGDVITDFLKSTCYSEDGIPFKFFRSTETGNFLEVEGEEKRVLIAALGFNKSKTKVLTKANVNTVEVSEEPDGIAEVDAMNMSYPTPQKNRTTFNDNVEKYSNVNQNPPSYASAARLSGNQGQGPDYQNHDARPPPHNQGNYPNPNKNNYNNPNRNPQNNYNNGQDNRGSYRDNQGNNRRNGPRGGRNNTRMERPSRQDAAAEWFRYLVSTMPLELKANAELCLSCARIGHGAGGCILYSGRPPGDRQCKICSGFHADNCMHGEYPDKEAMMRLQFNPADVVRPEDYIADNRYLAILKRVPLTDPRHATRFSPDRHPNLLGLITRSGINLLDAYENHTRNATQ